MKLTIDVKGKTYVPIAAVPYVTGGFFTMRDVIIMAAVPGMFAHAYGGTALDAFEFLPFGLLSYVAEERLSAVANICTYKLTDPPLETIGGMVVEEIELRDLMQRISEMESATRTQERRRPAPSWDIEAPLPPAVLQAMYKYLPIEFEFVTLRKNSREAMAKRINNAVNQIALNAGQSNIPFDRTCLPGHKTDFIKILCKIDRRIVGASSTLGEYFSELGLRWRPGSKAVEAAPLLALYGLTRRLTQVGVFL